MDRSEIRATWTWLRDVQRMPSESAHVAGAEQLGEDAEVEGTQERVRSDYEGCKEGAAGDVVVITMLFVKTALVVHTCISSHVLIVTNAISDWTDNSNGNIPRTSRKEDSLDRVQRAGLDLNDV